jgi:integrase
MAIKKIPKPTDRAGRCTRWRVIIYNRHSGKQEWHTIEGGKRDAEAFEREAKDKMKRGTYVAKASRVTFGQLAEQFLAACAARGRRRSTLDGYGGMLRNHLLPQFQHRECGTLRRSDFAQHFDAMLASGRSVELINGTIRTARAVLYFALERELIERNPLQRFRPYALPVERIRQRAARHSAFSEAELQRVLAAATDGDRAIVLTLATTGMRPGECFALRWEDYSDGTLRIERTLDLKARTFNPTKTKAGTRVVPVSRALAAELNAHRERTGGEGLMFASDAGTPLHYSNWRRRSWLPLLARAGVRPLTLYTLRRTFASYGRAAGESAHTVARLMGHSGPSLVDAVYATTIESAARTAAERIGARMLGERSGLAVIEGGKLRDVRRSLDGAADTARDEAQVTENSGAG